MSTIPETDEAGNGRKLTKQQLGRPVDEIPLHHLTPALQGMKDLGLTIGDCIAMGDKRSLNAKRIARCIKTGGWALSEEEIQAVDILGHQNVYLTPALESEWITVAVERQLFSDPNFPYTVEDLKKCAEENQEPDEKHLWKLCWIFGFPPEEQLRRVHFRCFSWTETDNAIQKWTPRAKSIKPGYYLMDWRSLFQSKGDRCLHYEWDEQEAALKEKGLHRAPAEMVLEAWCSHLLLTGVSTWVHFVCDHRDAILNTEGKPESFIHISPNSFGKKQFFPSVRIDEKQYGGVITYLPHRVP